VNGREAIEQFRHRPDVTLIDLQTQSHFSRRFGEGHHCLGVLVCSDK
jgi:hypothetical protein